MSNFSDKWKRTEKYRVLFGALVVTLSLSLSFYYGNMATYIDSYFRSLYGNHRSAIDPSWMLSSYLITACVGISLAGYIYKRCGMLVTVVGACILLDMTCFITYFSVQHSVSLTLFTLMILGGFYVGVILATCLMYAKSWFPGQHQGLVISVVSSGVGLGAIFYNQVTTYFINPKNLAPDYFEDNLFFFSQPEIIQRFPYVFILIGIISVILHVIGIPFLRKPPNWWTKETKDREDGRMLTLGIPPERASSTSNDDAEGKGLSTSNGNTNIKPTNSSRNTSVNHIDNHSEETTQFNATFHSKYDYSSNASFHKTTRHKDNTSLRNGNIHNITLESGTQNANGDGTISCNKHLQTTQIHNTHNETNERLSTEVNKAKNKDRTPKEAIQSLDFYILWMALCSIAFSYILVNNYYKLFGEMWIHDDDFLSLIGSTSTVIIAICRILSGLCIDRWGLKITITSILAIGSVLMIFWYLSAQANKIAFLLTTNVLAGVVSTFFSLAPITAAVRFGHSHFNEIYGLFQSSLMVMSMVAPPLCTFFISHVGWFWLFLFASVFGMVMMIMILVFIK